MKSDCCLESFTVHVQSIGLKTCLTFWTSSTVQGFGLKKNHVMTQWEGTECDKHVYHVLLITIQRIK